MKRLLLSVACALAFSPAMWAQTTFYFPQIADGGVFTTTIFIANPGASSTTANVTITFNDFADGDGNSIVPVFVDNQGQQFVGTVSFQLAGGKSRRLVSTAASAAVGVGFATVTSDITVTGSAIFSQFAGSPASSALVAEAGVNPSSTATSQAIFVDESGFRTALAYANPSLTDTASVNFNLLNAEGVSVLTTAKTLAPANHTSIFVFQLFESNSLVTDHFGTMQVTTDVPVTMMSLRFLQDFSIFTSVPPFTLASLILPIESRAQPLESWIAARPWLSPLASLGRILGALPFRSG